MKNLKLFICIALFAMAAIGIEFFKTNLLSEVKENVYIKTNSTKPMLVIGD